VWRSKNTVGDKVFLRPTKSRKFARGRSERLFDSVTDRRALCTRRLYDVDLIYAYQEEISQSRSRYFEVSQGWPS